MLKNFSVFLFVVGMSSVSTGAESLMDSINRRIQELSPGFAVTIGESLKPRQFVEKDSYMTQKQVQVPQKVFQAPMQAPVQAPSKISSVKTVHRVKACTLIPGRANRVARRADRAVSAESRIYGRTLLEEISPNQRTMLEVTSSTNCSNCDLGLVSATVLDTSTRPAQGVSINSLTTRELLESGSINRQVRTVNEPGVCGSGSCGGGRRGLFRR